MINIFEFSATTRPKITENTHSKWIDYGVDNNYYQYLIDRYIGSSTNHSIINGVCNMIYGQGLEATDKEQKPEEFKKLKQILSKNCLRKAILDLKLLGEASFQILYNLEGRPTEIKHFPRQTLRAEKQNSKGKIRAYYYHKDWKNPRIKELKRIPVLGEGEQETELLIIKRYVSGFNYYAPVDYPGGLAYAELEEEISDYLINDVQNSFSGTKVVNYNNDIPDEKQRREITEETNRKLTGAKGKKLIISFNKNPETRTTVDDIPLNDAPDHYDYLSKECFKKLIVAHRVTSPMLLGMRDGSDGLGNNADEIKTATQLFDNVTIKPYQQLILDSLKPVLEDCGITLDLYFKTLVPIEFTEAEDITDKAEKEKETGIKEHLSHANFNDEAFLEFFENLGEDLDGDLWELVEETNAGTHEEEANIQTKINGIDEGLKMSLSANEKSKWGDSGLYKLRYKYEGELSEKSRRFCREMIAKNQGSTFGKLYRKEDVDQLSSQSPNPGFGLAGAATYDLFLWKGGPNCHHYWKRMIFFRKRKDGKFIPRSKTEQMENDKRVANVPYVPQKKQEGQRNVDRADKGFKDG